MPQTVSSPESGDDNKPPGKEDGRLADANKSSDDDSDHRRIIGSWKSISYETDGQVDPTGAGGKAVIREEDMILHGMYMTYELDPSKQPKQIKTTGSPGIYKLEGDVLTLCIVTNSWSPQPTEFSTSKGDGRTLIVFRRLKPLASVEEQHTEYTGVKAMISEAIDLLEENKIDEFIKLFASPEEIDNLKSGHWEEAVRNVASQKQTYIKTFRAMLKLTPKMKDGGSTAIFDLTEVHIEGGSHFASLRCVKIGDRWYMRDR